jgi:biotin synthase
MLNLRFQHAEILAWLAEGDAEAIRALFAAADEVRATRVGPEVHLRALVEISNHCVRQCAYCGIRAGRAGLERYRMDAAEILDCARQAAAMNYGTIVLQAGEDPDITGPWMAGLVRQIKRETPLAVTLSLGERGAAELAAWRQAGADRYLLRFETSDLPLFRRIHPPAPEHGQEGLAACRLSLRESSAECRLSLHESGAAFAEPKATMPPDRLALLKQLRGLGYEIGSGIMIGIPGQSLASIAADVLLFRELDLDMIGVGPFIPHPATPLGVEPVAADECLVLKVIALARLACPEANIPSTTALATIDPRNGRELGLQCGANVVMPNLTPPAYRALYEIYPNKACVSETGEACSRCLAGRISALGRTIGRGPGGRRRAGHGS